MATSHCSKNWEKKEKDWLYNSPNRLVYPKQDNERYLSEIEINYKEITEGKKSSLLGKKRDYLGAYSK